MARSKATGRLVLIASALVLAIASVPGVAQDAADSSEREVERYRQMLKADPWCNPGMLDVDRGEGLWKTPRGPKNVSLEGCDLGKGRGVVKGAFAELPRYFADAGRVMDTEARLVWCMEKLQGFDRKALLTKPYPSGGQPTKDIGALATYVASQSNGLKFAPRLDHPKEKEALALGEALFFRRGGPMDFACATCHGDQGKRIRLQGLPFLSKPEEARKVMGDWPAYRVSTSNVMTMQQRVYDCFWQMRLPEVEFGSEVPVALTMYLYKTAGGGEINAPGLKR
jgi:sulfur-oxidizing protein SoxA